MGTKREEPQISEMALDPDDTNPRVRTLSHAFFTSWCEISVFYYYFPCLGYERNIPGFCFTFCSALVSASCFLFFCSGVTEFGDSKLFEIVRKIHKKCTNKPEHADGCRSSAQT